MYIYISSASYTTCLLFLLLYDLQFYYLHCKLLDLLSIMVENQINFASTFKIFQEGKIGGQGSLFLCKVRERRGPVGDHLNEGDLCAVKAIKSNL